MRKTADFVIITIRICFSLYSTCKRLWNNVTSINICLENIMISVLAISTKVSKSLWELIRYLPSVGDRSLNIFFVDTGELL